MNLKLEILTGSPSPEETAALCAALVVLARKRSQAPPALAPEPSLSPWARSGRLETTGLRGVALQQSIWACSERLAQPWQS